MSGPTSNSLGSAGSVANGAIATSTYTDSSQETTTTNSSTSNAIGGASYAAQITLGQGTTANDITSTTTDFGAINAAEGIAETAIQGNSDLVNQALQGQALLSQLTGQALNEATAAIAAKSTPISQTIAKYSTYIVAVVALAVVAGLYAIFSGKKKKDGA